MGDYVGIPSRRERDPIIEAIIENLEILTGVRGATGSVAYVAAQTAYLGDGTGSYATYFQDAAPLDNGQLSAGDLWFDSNDTNNQYRWSGSAWIDIRDTGINTALSDALDARATADGRSHTFYLPDTPLDSDIPNNANDATDVIAVGDIWLDTNDNNHLKRYDGGGWVSMRDGLTASSLQTWWQDEEPDHIPDGVQQGDLWFDTDDKNNIYRSNGSIWVDVRDTDISQALIDALAAHDTADLKRQVFYDVDMPSGDGEELGDLWVDIDDGYSLHRYDGATFQPIQDAAIGTAQTAADDAQGTAEIKAKTFYQTGIPTSISIGDLWVDTDDDNLLYRAAIVGATTIGVGFWETSRDLTIAIAQAAAEAAADDVVIAQAAADAAQSTADGRVVTFYEGPTPTAEGVGDLWVNTSSNDEMKFWNGATWEPLESETIASAASAAASAQDTADLKIVTFYQDADPAASASAGDIWVDTNSTPVNQTWRRNDTDDGWDEITDGGIAAAAQAAADAASDASDAQDDADAAIADIADIADDDIMSAVEKSQIILQVDVIIAEQAGIQAEATSFGVSLTAYNAAVTALVTTYLPTLTNPVLWSDVTGETLLGAGGGIVLRGKFEDVYTERQIVLDAIAAAAKVLADDAQADADTAATLAGTKVLTTYATSAPGSPSTGDMWVDTDSTPVNKMTFWDGDSWEPIQSQEIVDAYTTAVAADDKADGKITTWYQAADPDIAETVSSGDLWIETDSAPANKLWRRNAANDGWDDVADAAIQAAQDDADAAAALAGTKITTFVQGPAEPTALAAGDMWMDSSDGYNLYRASAAGDGFWVDVQDGAILTAQQAADAADALADGKIVTFLSDSPPVATTIGDIWIDTTAGANTMYIAEQTGSGDWTSVVDGSIATAQDTANGKNTIYRQDAPGPSSGVDAGDLWFDTADNNRPYVYVVDTWTLVNDTSAPVDLSVIKTASFTAVKGTRYPIDSTTEAVVMTLPTTPTANDEVYFFDYNESWHIFEASVATSDTTKIQGLDEDMILDAIYFSGGLMYINATVGWQLI